MGLLLFSYPSVLFETFLKSQYWLYKQITQQLFFSKRKKLVFICEAAGAARPRVSRGPGTGLHAGAPSLGSAQGLTLPGCWQTHRHYPNLHTGKAVL